MRWRSLFLLALGPTFLGCKENNSVDPYACETIAEACHGAALVSEIAAECHELGHDGELSECEPRRKECVTACAMIDASVPKDASYDDAEHHNDAEPHHHP